MLGGLGGGDVWNPHGFHTHRRLFYFGGNMKLPCGCEHDGEHYCECGEPICIAHYNPEDVIENHEITCDGCTKARKEIEKEIAEILEPAAPLADSLFDPAPEMRRLMKEQGFEQRVIDSLQVRVDPETDRQYQFRIAGDAADQQAFDQFLEDVHIREAKITMTTGGGKTKNSKVGTA
jgi:hypothetical protein